MAGEAAAADEADDPFGGGDKGKKKRSVSAEAERREALMLERFCLEPTEFGLFHPTAVQQSDARQQRALGYGRGPAAT